MLCYTEKTGGLQHNQTLAPNLPRRCRQTGLDAKGETPTKTEIQLFLNRDIFL
jgi:hypothetical protein